MGRALAIDYGKRRIGLAVSDELKIISKPYGVLEIKEIENIFLKISDIVIEKGIDEIIVGYPKTLKDKKSSITIEVDNFISELSEYISTPIILIDERLTSKLAQRILIEHGHDTGRDKGVIDEISAAIILSDYLDSNNWNDIPYNNISINDGIC